MSNKNNNKFKIKQDLYPLLLTVTGIICAFLATELLVYPDRNLNEGSILIYITITTLVSSLMLPVFNLLNINSNKAKFYSLGLGIFTSLIIFIYSAFYNQTFFEHLISFSQRGGITAISLALLLLQLAKINYSTQIEEEEKRINEDKKNKKKILQLKNKDKKNKNKIIQLKKENIKLKK